MKFIYVIGIWLLSLKNKPNKKIIKNAKGYSMGNRALFWLLIRRTFKGAKQK